MTADDGADLEIEALGRRVADLTAEVSRLKMEAAKVNLFRLGEFTLRSGASSRWKIECDALTPGDWAALAAMAAEWLPDFRAVVGVPRGGLPFADALDRYATGKESHPVLVAEDVVTTGGSMERFRAAAVRAVDEYVGVCVFARGDPPPWVVPLFRMPARGRERIAEPLPPSNGNQTVGGL